MLPPAVPIEGTVPFRNWHSSDLHGPTSWDCAFVLLAGSIDWVQGLPFAASYLCTFLVQPSAPACLLVVLQAAEHCWAIANAQNGAGGSA